MLSANFMRKPISLSSLCYALVRSYTLSDGDVRIENGLECTKYEHCLDNATSKKFNEFSQHSYCVVFSASTVPPDAVARDVIE